MEVSEHNRPELEGTSKLFEVPSKEISMASEAEDKRWSLVDKLSKLLNESLESCFPDLKEEAEFFRSNEDDPAGDYYCKNFVTIWHKISKSPELRKDHPHITQQADVGKAIMNHLQKSDNIHMIEGQPSVSDVGFVTFSLSSKWMAERIHKMLQDGIDTWAPKLPVESVLVKYRCGKGSNETKIDELRRLAITNTIITMLRCSKVDANMCPTLDKEMLDSLEDWDEDRLRTEYNWEMFVRHEERDKARTKNKVSWAPTEDPLVPSLLEDILIKCFFIKRSGTDLKIRLDDKPPFILAAGRSKHFYDDLKSLWYGFKKQKDWIIFVAPVRDQEYVEMCFTVSKLEKWAPTDRKCKWIPDGTSYAGYGTCITEPKEELASFLREVKIRCKAVAEGDAQMLGYTAIAVYICVFRYTFLKINRLAKCSLTLAEMVGEEGNTFLYLLKTRAKIRGITDARRKNINELIKASELMVEENKRWGECEERALELHLLEFTEALKKSCSYLSPHILCEYLYGLSKKFTNYYSSMPKVESIAKSTLLFCEATAIVMDKCFELLRLTPDSEMDFKTDYPKEDYFQGLFESDSDSWDPPRNSRFELFSIRPYIKKNPEFKKGEMVGFIAISDKYRMHGGSHLFEPDFANTPLLNQELRKPINMHNGEYIYLGNPNSRHSVAFSSSFEIGMDIYVTTEKNACFEPCSRKFKLDLSKILGKNAGNQCSYIDIEGADGNTEMYFMLMKDAVDAAVEIRYKTETNANEAHVSKVRGQIYAYYGSDILDHCRASMRPCYWALLFRSDVPVALEGDKIPLRKSVMAVPKGAPLKIFAYLYDVKSEKVILDDIRELESKTEGSSEDVIEGFELKSKTKGSSEDDIERFDKETRCSLSLKVNWTYQAQYY